MKKIYLIFSLCTTSLYSQITNPGFELLRDTLPSLPSGWKARTHDHYSWQVDSTQSHSGKHSLKIHNELNQDTLIFSAFSQVCSIRTTNVKKILLSVYIKTENTSRDAGLWCQLWDKNDKTTGFVSLQTLRITTPRTGNWTKFSLELIINPEIKKLLFGGFLKGTGTVWYDDFSIEENKLATSKTAVKFIRNIVDITKRHSIVADSLNWKTVREDIISIANGAQTTTQCYEAVNYLIEELRKKGDNHSYFYPPTFNTKNETINMDGRQPEGRYLGDSTGYIKVPGFMSVHKDTGVRFATRIQELIKQIDSSNRIVNWIVDLRDNTGGNMYPMIAGLGPLFQEGILGYFYSPKNKKESSWFYNNGSAGGGKFSVCKVEKPYLLKHTIPKIIVLTGSNTASSGEMVVISFKGNKNTSFIGMSTAGYSTGNAGHLLSDGSVLNLCESYCRDRNKTPYYGKIAPDKLIIDELNNRMDTTIEYAKKQFYK